MKKVLSTLLGLLAPPWIGSVAGLAIMYQVCICGFSLTIPQFILVCCLLPLALFSTAPLCQLGTALAAWLVGQRVVEVSLFGLALYRADPASPWRLRRTTSLFLPPGTVTLGRDGTALRWRHLITVLGGVMIQFLIAILCLVAGQSIFSPLDGLFPIPPGLPGKMAFLFPNTPLIASLNLFAIAYVTFGLSSLVLTEPGTPPSNGTQLLALLGEPHVVRSIALCYLQGWLAFGVRPRDWEPSLVAQLEDPGSPPSELPAVLYLYYYHEDRGETAIAERYLLRAIDLCSESRPVSSGLAVEAAYVAGLHHRDGMKAREWLTQVKPEEVEPHTRERAEAATLLAEKQLSRAIAIAEQGLASSWKSVDPGGAKAERDWLQIIIDTGQRELDSPLNRPLPTPD